MCKLSFSNKKTFILPVLFFLFLVSCQKDNGLELTQATTVTETRASHEVCIRTYNTYLLDTPNIGVGEFGPQCDGQDCIDRANAICEEVTNGMPEVINLQEVWVDEAAEALMACLEAKGYSVFYDPGCDGTHIDPNCTGLLTATTLPVNFIEKQNFNCGSGFDATKDKGFVFGEFKLENGCVIQNINTHLQADNGDLFAFTDIYARQVQIDKIKQYINQKTKAGVPLYLGGDFNITPSSPQFTSLLSLGADSYSVTGVRPRYTSSGGDVLDYFFINGLDGNTTINGVTTIPAINTSSTTITKYHLKLICDTDNVIYVGVFNSLREVQDYIAPEGCLKKITTITEVVSPPGPFTVSDHLQVEMCFTYNCEEQVLNSDVDLCEDRGCTWENGQCECGDDEAIAECEAEFGCIWNYYHRRCECK